MVFIPPPALQFTPAAHRRDTGTSSPAKLPKQAPRWPIGTNEPSARPSTLSTQTPSTVHQQSSIPCSASEPRTGVKPVRGEQSTDDLGGASTIGVEMRPPVRGARPMSATRGHPRQAPPKYGLAGAAEPAYGRPQFVPTGHPSVKTRACESLLLPSKCSDVLK